MDCKTSINLGGTSFGNSVTKLARLIKSAISVNSKYGSGFASIKGGTSSGKNFYIRLRLTGDAKSGIEEADDAAWDVGDAKSGGEVADGDEGDF